MEPYNKLDYLKVKIADCESHLRERTDCAL